MVHLPAVQLAYPAQVMRQQKQPKQQEAISTTETASSSAAPDWSGYDSLVKEIKSDTDLVDREAKMHQAEDMLMATGAILPIYYYNDLYMQKTNVDKIYSTIFGTKFFMYATKTGSDSDKVL